MTDSDNYEEDEGIIFPPQTSSIIIRLAEKYKIKETTAEMIEKINKGDTPNVTKIAETVSVMADDEIPFTEVTSILQSKLNLTPETAEALADDLEKQVLSLVEKSSLQKPSQKKTQIKKPPAPDDSYREMIQ